jgi:hypothetical protein
MELQRHKIPLSNHHQYHKTEQQKNHILII